jgi:hypothetical protein
MLGAASENAVTSRMIPEHTMQRKTWPIVITGDAICDFRVNPRVPKT